MPAHRRQIYGEATDAGFNPRNNYPGHRVRSLPGAGGNLLLAAAGPKRRGLHRLPQSRPRKRGNRYPGCFHVWHLGAAQSGRVRRQFWHHLPGGLRHWHGRHSRYVYVCRPPHPPVNAQRTLHHRVRPAPVRDGALRDHIPGHNLHHGHLYHRRIDGHYRRGTGTYQFSPLGHCDSGWRGGYRLHCLWRPPHVHLYRPHPVLGADTRAALAGCRRRRPAGRHQRLVRGQRGRPAVRQHAA